MPITTAGGLADSTVSFIADAQTTADSAISALNTAAAGWTAASWSAISTPSTGTYSLFTEDAAVKTALEAFDSTLNGITLGALAAAPNLSGYNAPIWSETYWTNLKTLLTDFTSTITSSDGVDTTIDKLTNETTQLQVALYAADRERKQQALRDSYSAADSSTGKKGFTYPNSMTVALKLDAQQKYQFDLSQTSRDLVKLIFEWAKSNYQFSVQQAIASHTADTEFNTRYAGVLLQLFESQVKTSLEEYRTEVLTEAAKMDQKIKEYQLRVDAYKANAGITEANDRINASLFSTEVQQHATDVAQAVETAARNARNKIDAAIAAVNAAASMVASANQTAIGVLSA